MRSQSGAAPRGREGCWGTARPKRRRQAPPRGGTLALLQRLHQGTSQTAVIRKLSQERLDPPNRSPVVRTFQKTVNGLDLGRIWSVLGLSRFLRGPSRHSSGSSWRLTSARRRYRIRSRETEASRSLADSQSVRGVFDQRSRQARAQLAQTVFCLSQEATGWLRKSCLAHVSPRNRHSWTTRPRRGS